MPIPTYVEVPRGEVADRLLAEMVRDLAVRALGLQRVYIRYFRHAACLDERFKALLATACGLHRAGEFADDRRLLGMTSYQDHRTIWVRSDLSGWQLARVVAHEVRHCWQHVSWPVAETEEDIARAESDAETWAQSFIADLRVRLDVHEHLEVT